MIRVDRGPEPGELPGKREQGLRRLRERSEREGSLEPGDFQGYEVAAVPLFLAQGKKCCYCEKDFERAYNDVEHFRPKARAQRGPGFSEHGYWWLAWTWENLFFACPSCNRTYKNMQFPLGEGSVPLVPEQQPPGAERPMLIDPCRDDPLDFIEFRPVTIRGRTTWLPHGKNPRGDKTIEVLGLDREGLVGLYTEHVNRDVRAKITSFKRVIDSGESRAIQQEWRRLVRSLLRRDARFAALSHDVLAHEFPEARREEWRLELPRPPI